MRTLSPLNRRLPREFRRNPGKWLGITLLLTLSISMVSGFLMASSSMSRIVSAVDSDYNLEDGHFTSNFELNDGVIGRIESLGVAVHDNFSYDVPLTVADGGAVMTARVYLNRQGFDLPAYFEGKAPDAPNEIALDRVFCRNNGLAVGDVVTVGGNRFVLSGIMSLSDYQALFEKNTDFVFNAQTFTVAQVSESGFSAFKPDTCTYTYSFTADDRTLDDSARASLERDILDTLQDENVSLADFVDKDANNGIGYAEDDLESDRVMWVVMLYILIAILAFVFAVLTSSIVEEESAVIGTLMALGYRKSEIIRHYLALPLISGAVGAVAGNALGYVFVINKMSDLYYNSYSLPPYQTIWDWGVFAQSTLLPLCLLAAINFAGLALKLRCTPLQFLHRETSRRNRGGGRKLPEALSFSIRFRLRILGRNASHFVTLFAGILFASLLLLFGFCMLPTIDRYADSLAENLVSEHTYTLKAPVELRGTAEQREAHAAALKLADTVDMSSFKFDDTDPNDADLGGLSLQGFFDLTQKASHIDKDAYAVNTRENSEEAIAQAEKFSSARLEFNRGGGAGWESVVLYGIQRDSRYYNSLEFSNDTATIGYGLASKFNLDVGDVVSLYDKYTDTTYDLAIGSVWGSDGDTNVYLPLETMNKLLGNDDRYFTGYFSDRELDIDNHYMGSDITPSQMDKIGAQMRDSMGDMVYVMVGASLAIYIVLMYLLTKTVIERNARSISHMKVFGYTDREINGLYVRTITETVAISLVAAVPIVTELIVLLIKLVFMHYNGNFVISLPLDRVAIELALGGACYGAVAYLHVRRIRKVPLALAMKTQE